MNKILANSYLTITVTAVLSACSSAPSEPAATSQMVTPSAHVAAINTVTPMAPATSGVQGSLMLSPGCPGPQVAGRNCTQILPDRTVELLDERGSVVARAATTADGGYRLQAAPGHYTLQVVRQGLYPRCPNMSVTIAAGSMANGSITCDSGMR